ncbi:hypothetical protein LGK95_11305 [Clostridium algoriphilum]|uniref:hypothetical protein n=1 Tax=Clostridium algoriphilum TaxID=198347 RepID=UPI001CF1BDF4|nr:hypothetical protein [Clostridium algoriphilum]MCB2294106.1 hypothetical protein [Clostridium algoriphilum]
MNVKSKNGSKKLGKSAISIVLYIIAAIVAIMGVALLVNNIYLFKNTVSQYVAQGYAAATVKKELMTSQLLPGIFEPVGVYGGIAFLLLGVGIVNKKVSNCLRLLTKAEVCNDIIEEDVVNPNVVNAGNADITKKTENVKNIEKA